MKLGLAPHTQAILIILTSCYTSHIGKMFGEMQYAVQKYVKTTYAADKRNAML